MIAGSCICGGVRWEITALPDWAVSCNCSVCRRYGAIWAHRARKEVTLSGDTRGFTRGEGLIAFRHCPVCGCLTHYCATQAGPEARVSVNLRMAAPEIVEAIRIRRFDGAESWRFLD